MNKSYHLGLAGLDQTLQRAYKTAVLWRES